MEQKHTPEPWRLTTDWEEPGHVYITGVEGGDPNECVVRFDDDYGSPQGQNAKRIVAAVNHTEGYTNEQLEAVPMPDMADVIQRFVSHFEYVEEGHRIPKLIRDALLILDKLKVTESQ